MWHCTYLDLCVTLVLTWALCDLDTCIKLCVTLYLLWPLCDLGTKFNLSVTLVPSLTDVWPLYQICPMCDFSTNFDICVTLVQSLIFPWPGYNNCMTLLTNLTFLWLYYQVCPFCDLGIKMCLSLTFVWLCIDFGQIHVGWPLYDLVWPWYLVNLCVTLVTSWPFCYLCTWLVDWDTTDVWCHDLIVLQNCSCSWCPEPKGCFKTREEYALYLFHPNNR